MSIPGEEVLSDEFDRAVAFLKRKIGASGLPPNEWYVGITNDVARRLQEHGVDETQAVPVKTSSQPIARAVERFMQAQGCQGGENEGRTGPDTVYVYIYKGIRLGAP